MCNFAFHVRSSSKPRSDDRRRQPERCCRSRVVASRFPPSPVRKRLPPLALPCPARSPNRSRRQHANSSAQQNVFHVPHALRVAPRSLQAPRSRSPVCSLTDCNISSSNRLHSELVSFNNAKQLLTHSTHCAGAERQHQVTRLHIVAQCCGRVLEWRRCNSTSL